MDKQFTPPPLPRGFAEEERRKFWRRKQYEDVIARLTAERDALAAAARLYIAWTDAEDDHSKADFYERIGMCAAAEKATRAALASIKQGGAQ